MVGVVGRHVGTVDDGRIVLTKTDPDAVGDHHAIPIEWVGTVDGEVRLMRPAADAEAGWERAGRPGDDPKT